MVSNTYFLYEFHGLWFYYGASKIFGPSTQLGADTEKIQEIFGKSDTYVLLVPKEDTATQKELSDENDDRKKKQIKFGKKQEEKKSE